MCSLQLCQHGVLLTFSVLRRDEGLPTSLFTPFEELPPEGRVTAKSP